MFQDHKWRGAEQGEGLRGASARQEPNRPDEVQERPAESGPAEQAEPPRQQAEPITTRPPGLGEAVTSVASDSGEGGQPKRAPRKIRRHRRRKKDAWEAALQGRRDLCYRIAGIAPRMLKMVMTRVASCHLPSTRGLSEERLREELLRAAPHIADKNRVKKVLTALDPVRHRRELKGMIVFDVLLEQERYALPAKELAGKVHEYEKQVIKEARTCKFLDPKEMDKARLFAYETYYLVLDAAWRHEDRISVDEANLLAELRRRLGITLRDHRLLEAKMGRFPKRKGALHTIEEIEDTRRQLQKDGILWTFRDEDGTDIDAIPAEIMEVIRSEMKQVDLQRVNFKRLLQNKAWSNDDFRRVLRAHGLDAGGNKADMVSRILDSRLTPTQLLGSASVSKLQAVCRAVGLVSYGTKSDIVARLIEFYDNLTFEPIVERDERAQWYAAYELLAARKYSELKAQGLIEKQEQVDAAFEKATDFLFEKRLHLNPVKNLPLRAPDGKLCLPQRQVVLWDCKSDERAVNLQDHLDSQFDRYMRAEASQGNHVLYFLVIGPRFTANSLRVARKYKMATNWDVPLATARALKRMADKWHNAKPNQPFPVGLLNLTDMIDDDRADELLSLVL